MMNLLENIEKHKETVKKEFERQFMFNLPFSEYIVECSWQEDDLGIPYLFVGLNKPKPESLSLPARWFNYDVVIKVVGKLKLAT